MNAQEFAELSAGHALAALSPADEQAFQRALAEHPEWAAQVVADEGTAALLADGVAASAPPAAVRDALLARIAAPSASVPPASATPAAAAAEPRRPRRWGAKAWFALAASLLLVLAVGVGATVLAQQLTRPAAVVALDRIDQAPDARTAEAPTPDGGTATLHWSASLGEAVLVSDGMPSIASDQDFQLWFVRDGAAVSAGVFDTDAGGSATALLTGTIEPGDTVAVTVEAAGGSKTGAPTTQPLFAIPTT